MLSNSSDKLLHLWIAAHLTPPAVFDKLNKNYESDITVTDRLSHVLPGRVPLSASAQPKRNALSKLLRYSRAIAFSTNLSV